MQETGTWRLMHRTVAALSAFFYNHANWLGTEEARSDVNGNLCETTSSLPFGDAQQTSGSCSPTPLFFTGKERDSESGNDYFGARYYASSMGRWLSPDYDGDDDGPPEPVPYADFSDPQSLNLYSYVENSPLSAFDSDGHDCVNTSNAANGSILVQTTSDSSACLSGFTYVNGTVDPNSVTYNGETGDVNFNISNYADGSGISGAVDLGAPASFDESLMYNTFGPPSAATWNNASGTVNTMGSILLTAGSLAFPLEGLAVSIGSGKDTNGASAAAVTRKPGTLGLRKGTDALRRENKIARDISKELGLGKDGENTVHELLQEGSQMEGRALTYQEGLQYVKDALGLVE